MVQVSLPSDSLPDDLLSSSYPQPSPYPGAYVEVTADHVRMRSDNPKTPGNVYNLRYSAATGRWSCSCPAAKRCKHQSRMEPPAHVTPRVPVGRPQLHGLAQLTPTPTMIPTAVPASDAGLPLSSLPIHTAHHRHVEASDHVTAGAAIICRRCRGRRTAHPSGLCPLCAGKAAAPGALAVPVAGNADTQPTATATIVAAPSKRGSHGVCAACGETGILYADGRCVLGCHGATVIYDSRDSRRRQRGAA